MFRFDDPGLSFEIGTCVYDPDTDLATCRDCDTKFHVDNGGLVNPVTMQIVHECPACELIEPTEPTLENWGVF
jgi:hypothetical protein